VLLIAHLIAGYDEPPPLEEVMAFLATWDQVPKAQLLEVRHHNLQCTAVSRVLHQDPLHDLLPDDICPAVQITVSWHMLLLSTATHSVISFPALRQVFERGHFAGVEEMRTNERLFNRVAPMGVNDIAMACMYKFTGLHRLDIPMTSFDGLADNTIDQGAFMPWVSRHYEAVRAMRWSSSSCCNTTELAATIEVDLPRMLTAACVPRGIARVL
jgi:hypothetical protein